MKHGLALLSIVCLVGCGFLPANPPRVFADLKPLGPPRGMGRIEMRRDGDSFIFSGQLAGLEPNMPYAVRFERSPTCGVPYAGASRDLYGQILG